MPPKRGGKIKANQKTKPGNVEEQQPSTSTSGKLSEKTLFNDPPVDEGSSSSIRLPDFLSNSQDIRPFEDENSENYYKVSQFCRDWFTNHSNFEEIFDRYYNLNLEIPADVPKERFRNSTIRRLMSDPFKRTHRTHSILKDFKFNSEKDEAIAKMLLIHPKIASQDDLVELGLMQFEKGLKLFSTVEMKDDIVDYFGLQAVKRQNPDNRNFFILRNYHMHSGTIIFIDSKEITIEWLCEETNFNAVFKMLSKIDKVPTFVLNTYKNAVFDLLRNNIYHFRDHLTAGSSHAAAEYDVKLEFSNPRHMWLVYDLKKKNEDEVSRDIETFYARTNASIILRWKNPKTREHYKRIEVFEMFCQRASGCKMQPPFHQMEYYCPPKADEHHKTADSVADLVIENVELVDNDEEMKVVETVVNETQPLNVPSTSDFIVQTAAYSISEYESSSRNRNSYSNFFIEPIATSSGVQRRQRVAFRDRDSFENQVDLNVPETFPKTIVKEVSVGATASTSNSADSPKCPIIDDNDNVQTHEEPERRQNRDENASVNIPATSTPIPLKHDDDQGVSEWVNAHPIVSENPPEFPKTLLKDRKIPENQKRLITILIGSTKFVTHVKRFYHTQTYKENISDIWKDKINKQRILINHIRKKIDECAFESLESDCGGEPNLISKIREFKDFMESSKPVNQVPQELLFHSPPARNPAYSDAPRSNQTQIEQKHLASQTPINSNPNEFFKCLNLETSQISNTIRDAALPVLPLSITPGSIDSSKLPSIDENLNNVQTKDIVVNAERVVENATANIPSTSTPIPLKHVDQRVLDWVNAHPIVSENPSEFPKTLLKDRKIPENQKRLITILIGSTKFVTHVKRFYHTQTYKENISDIWKDKTNKQRILINHIRKKIDECAYESLESDCGGEPNLISKIREFKDFMESSKPVDPVPQELLFHSPPARNPAYSDAPRSNQTQSEQQYVPYQTSQIPNNIMDVSLPVLPPENIKQENLTESPLFPENSDVICMGTMPINVIDLVSPEKPAPLIYMNQLEESNPNELVMMIERGSQPSQEFSQNSETPTKIRTKRRSPRALNLSDEPIRKSKRINK